MPNYPTACESFATVSALNHKGFEIEINEFLDKYLETIDYIPSNFPENECILDHYFYGNPRSYHGTLCYPPVIVNGVESYFLDVNSKECSVEDTTGYALEKFINELLDDNSVIIWVSTDYSIPKLIERTWATYYSPSHAVVVSGNSADTGVVHLSDSISGDVYISFDKLEKIYNTMQKRSVVIR